MQIQIHMRGKFLHISKEIVTKYNKSEEPINYPVGNLLAHFKRYQIQEYK